MKEMLRIFNTKSRIVVHKQPPEQITRTNSVASSSMDGKRPSALTEMLLKPQQSSKESVSDMDFKVLPRSASGDYQYIVFKKDLDVYFYNLHLLKEEDAAASLKFTKLNKLELDNGQIGQILSTYQSSTVQFLYT